jgi:hypothetical protein
VAHYDGLIRPSEIRIQSLRLWVRFYDLPSAMMKPEIAKQLGAQIGPVLNYDSQYLGYLQVWVEYPLSKPLLPQLMVKVKGQGPMPITLRYKNVPHFCFSCRRIGHAALSCEEEANKENGVSFGEELWASPPKQVRDISVKPMASRVARSPFQVPGMSGSYRSGLPKG